MSTKMSHPIDPGQALTGSFDSDVGGLRTVLTGGNLVPDKYDSIELSYVEDGFGVGEIGQVIYKLEGNIIATLTLSYNSSNKLQTVTRT